QDNYANPSEPTAAMTFSQFGIRDFSVQYWDGANWVTVPNATVTNNSLVWRQFTFAPLTTSRIRILITNALAGYSRLTEVEAYPPAGPTNNPPTVTWTGAANGTTYLAPATIALAATASDSDGTITQVAFLANGVTMVIDTTAPYAFSWPNVTA